MAKTDWPVVVVQWSKDPSSSPVDGRFFIVWKIRKGAGNILWKILPNFFRTCLNLAATTKDSVVLEIVISPQNE